MGEDEEDRSLDIGIEALQNGKRNNLRRGTIPGCILDTCINIGVG